MDDLNDIVLEATLTKAKNKEGKPYVYLSIMITPNIEKKVFLEASELELLRLTYGE